MTQQETDGKALGSLAATEGVSAGYIAPEAASHADCHDLVCNGDRRQPRGARGVSCSCRGRDTAYQDRDELLKALKDLWDWVDGMHYSGSVIDSAKAAIQKAEGR